MIAFGIDGYLSDSFNEIDFMISFTAFLFEVILQDSIKIVYPFRVILRTTKLGFGQQNVYEEPFIQSDPRPTDAGTILGEIQNILFQNRAVPSEAAGIALKLILCGTGNSE